MQYPDSQSLPSIVRLSIFLSLSDIPGTLSTNRYLSMLMEGGTKQHRDFWRNMSGELFSNVKELFTQIDCWIQEREPGDGTGAQLAVSHSPHLLSLGCLFSDWF